MANKIEQVPEAVRKDMIANTTIMKTLAGQIQGNLAKLLEAISEIQGDVDVRQD